MRALWIEKVFQFFLGLQSETVEIYLPKDETVPGQIAAFTTVMKHLTAKDFPLPITGFSQQIVNGGFRLSVDDDIENDIICILVIRNWRPPNMKQEEFLLVLDRLRHFIAGAYAAAGCPQKKILIEITRGAKELT